MLCENVGESLVQPSPTVRQMNRQVGDEAEWPHTGHVCVCARQKNKEHSVSAAIIATGFSVVIPGSQRQTGELELKPIFEVHLNCLYIWITWLMSYQSKYSIAIPRFIMRSFFFLRKQFVSPVFGLRFDHDNHPSGINKNKKGETTTSGCLIS